MRLCAVKNKSIFGITQHPRLIDLLFDVVIDLSIFSAPCLRKKMEIQQSHDNGLPLIGVTEPICDTDGYFRASQCYGSV